MTRLFEFTDLPLLYRYRGQGIFFDSQKTCTWGTGLIPLGAVLSPFSTNMGIHTLVDSNEEGALIGQVTISSERSSAHLSFFLPVEEITPNKVCTLVEEIRSISGNHEARYLIADVEEESEIFRILAGMGFRIFDRQRIWRFVDSVETDPDSKLDVWRNALEIDQINISHLYRALVPSLSRNVEDCPKDVSKLIVNYSKGNLVAFAEFAQGPQGVWIMPFFHPEIPDLEGTVASLLRTMLPRRIRPLHISVRTHQAWVEPVLKKFKADPGEARLMIACPLVVTNRIFDTVKYSAIEKKVLKSTSTILPPNSIINKGVVDKIAFPEK
ncbi:MAG: hypothetical protein JXA19_01260 [Anaerolineales bacterium]|nr:hypothetical protein [Anaerolineales bacterium]